MGTQKYTLQCGESDIQIQLDLRMAPIRVGQSQYSDKLNTALGRSLRTSAEAVKFRNQREEHDHGRPYFTQTARYED